MKPEPESPEEFLRDTLRKSGQSVYAVAKATGIPQPVLHRFMAGEHGMTLRTAEKLMRHFGLELRPKTE
jgi:plasmid maintenance system antidote protein VapI